MAIAILQCILIICMLVFISGLFIVHFLPNRRIVKFLQKHERVQAIVAIMLYTGFAAACFAVLY